MENLFGQTIYYEEMGGCNGDCHGSCRGSCSGACYGSGPRSTWPKH